MRGVRVGYRTVRRLARSVGVSMAPWTRNAWDAPAWCATFEVKDRVVECLTDGAARVRDFFDASAIRRTLDLAFETHEVAIEVPLNLFRAEHMLRKLESFRRLAPKAETRMNPVLTTPR
jgi:hypothetical protein